LCRAAGLTSDVAEYADHIIPCFAAEEIDKHQALLKKSTDRGRGI